MLRPEALLADDVIVPVHAHDERDDHFVSLADGTPRRVGPEEAGAIAAAHHGIGTLADAEIADDGPRRVNRRGAVRAGAALLGALLAPAAFPRYSFAAGGTGDTLVCIFLRGGFDGLSALVPVGDPSYYRLRGSIAVPDTSVIGLSTGYGMHPGMASLKPMWDAGQLAFVPATGSPWITRSHFDDMYAAERCAPASVRTGWLGRHLASSSSSQGTFRGITIGDRAAVALTTSWPTISMTSIKDFDLNCWSGYRTQMLRSIDAMYGAAAGGVGAQADATLAAIGALDDIRSVTYPPENGATYPTSRFGSGLAQIAQLIKAGKGVEVACIDVGDWDMHQGLGSATDSAAWFTRKITELADGLAAFRTDLGSRWASTSVVTMSEFGRRVAVNGDGGVDHGRGGLMLFAGGGIKGGIRGTLAPLTGAGLDDGDVAISTDYRAPLSELVRVRLANPALPTVFPGYTPPTTSLGIA